MKPDKAPVDGLVPFRTRINELDDSLIDLLARRLAICEQVARYKRTHGIAVMQPDRVAAVKERCADLAAARGLSREFARDLYERIIGEACALETEIVDK